MKTFKEFKEQKIKGDNSIFGLLFCIHNYFQVYKPSTKTADSVCASLMTEQEFLVWNFYLVQSYTYEKDNFLRIGPQELREHFDNALKMDTNQSIDFFPWNPFEGISNEDLEEAERGMS